MQSNISRGSPQIFPFVFASSATETYLVFLTIFPSIKVVLKWSPQEKFLISNNSWLQDYGVKYGKKKKKPL